jgi:acyl-CoA thioesterase-1
MKHQQPKPSILKRMLKVAAIIIAIMLVIAGLRLIFLFRDVAGFKQFWDERGNQNIPDNALVYIALGDSAAQGIGASEPMKGYVGLVAKELESRTGRPVHVINLSVSGATVESTTQKQLQQLKELKNLDQAVITIDIGANDVNRDLIDKNEFERQLDALLKELPPQTVVGDLPSFARTRFWKAEQRIQEFNPILHKVADLYGLKVAPLYEKTSSDKSLFTNSSDIFHPSDRGYRNWANAFIEKLQ